MARVRLDGSHRERPRLRRTYQGADRLTPEPGKPTFIIANTVKGKGVSFMENVVKWHHGVPSERNSKQALAELEAADSDLSKGTGSTA